MSTPRRKTARQSQRSRRSFAPETRTKDPSRANAGPARQIVAAIFNTSPDVVDLLRKALEPAGVVAVSVLTHQIREGVVDVAGFLAQHDPAVVIYDIAPPYDANWHLFQCISQWMPCVIGQPS